MRDRGE
jgi:hypothetical protein